MTLKYGQGHWKWHEQVKLNEWCHHTKFHIYCIYSVRENRNVNVFATPDNQPAGQHWSLHRLTFFMWIKKCIKLWLKTGCAEFRSFTTPATALCWISRITQSLIWIYCNSLVHISRHLWSTPNLLNATLCVTDFFLLSKTNRIIW